MGCKTVSVFVALLLVATGAVPVSPASGPGSGQVQGSDDLNPTPVWVVFADKGASTLDGQPLPVGAVVRAYDPTGILAGRQEVALAGWYLVHVYADDHVLTPQLDEGADPGDPIRFTVNGYPAVPPGPDAAVWNVPADLVVNVELRASRLAGDFDCDCQVTVRDLMRQARSAGTTWGQAGYYPPFDRDGDDDIDSADLQQVAGQWHTSCSG